MVFEAAPEYAGEVENYNNLHGLTLVHKLSHQTIYARFWHLSGKPANIVSQNKLFTRIKFIDIYEYPMHRLMHKFLEKIKTNKQFSKI